MSQKYSTPEDEYKKCKDLKKEDVITIQNWMKEQPHLPKISEHKIIAFLFASNFKIEAAKNCIEAYYTIRAHWPELMANRDILSKDLQQALNMALTTILPERTKENYQIGFSKFMDTDPTVFDHEAFMQLFDMSSVCWYRKVGTSEGNVLVIDVEGLAMPHMLRCDPILIKRCICFFQEAVPAILNAVHIINVKPLTEMLLGVAKPYMTDEVYNKIHLHKEIDTLYEHISKEALPNEYGGEAGTCESLHENFVKLMEDNAKYLLEDAKEIVDESKRIGERNLNEIFEEISFD